MYVIHLNEHKGQNILSVDTGGNVSIWERY